MNDFLVMAMQRSGHHAIISWLCKLIPNKILKINHYNYHDGNGGTSTILKGENPQIRMINFENPDISELRNYNYPAGNYNKIVVVRDPYNMFASRQKMLNRGGTKNTPTMIERYKKQLRQLVGREEYLDARFINYNSWLTDGDYRKEIATEYGLKTIDYNFKKSVHESSFKNDENYLVRYKSLLNNTKYRLIFRDEELNDLALEAFPEFGKVI